MIPPPRLRRCITMPLSDSQLQSIERESANRSLFARELVVGTLSQTLPELAQQQRDQQQQQQQQQSGVQTPASSTTTATSSPETPNASTVAAAATAAAATKKQSRDQGATASSTSSKSSMVPTMVQQTHNVTGSIAASSFGTGLPSQGLPPNPSGTAGSQNNSSMVPTLIHAVIPTPLVSWFFFFSFFFRFLHGTVVFVKENGNCSEFLTVKIFEYRKWNNWPVLNFFLFSFPKKLV